MEKVFRHNHNGKGNPMYGKRHSEEAKQKIAQKRLGQRNSPETEFKKGQSPWNKGRRDYQRGIKKNFSEETRKNLIKNLKGFTGNASQTAYERILKECEELRKQGFRVIPIGKVIPDIIAIK